VLEAKIQGVKSKKIVKHPWRDVRVRNLKQTFGMSGQTLLLVERSKFLKRMLEVTKEC